MEDLTFTVKVDVEVDGKWHEISIAYNGKDGKAAAAVLLDGKFVKCQNLMIWKEYLEQGK